MKWRFLVAALTSRPGRVWPCRCFWFICWGFLRLSSCLDVGRTAILQRSSPYETATTSSAGSLHIKQYEMGLIKSWSRSVSACERSIFEECQIVWWMCGEEKNQAETCHQVISSICSALLFYMALEMLCVFSCSLICSRELNEQLHRENCPKWHYYYIITILDWQGKISSTLFHIYQLLSVTTQNLHTAPEKTHYCLIFHIFLTEILNDFRISQMKFDKFNQNWTKIIYDFQCF